MTYCDNCNDDVTHVWKHREYEQEMTHREVQWLCAECHPGLDGSLKQTAE